MLSNTDMWEEVEVLETIPHFHGRGHVVVFS